MPQTFEHPPLLYDVDHGRLGPELSAKFCQLEKDEATAAWLREVGARPHGWWTTKLVSLWSDYASLYDVHGRLGSYAMHLLSTSAYRTLLEDGGQTHWSSLLDVGAGAGYVTENARPLFDEIVCTETSAPLAKRLQKRGFLVHVQDLAARPLGRQFPVVSCLNVLDRTARPHTLLDALGAHVANDGRLLLSVPLPVSAHVQVRGGTISASERLPTLARDFESAASELTRQLFLPRGFTVQRFARVPYLSRGDSHAPYYVLSAGVWVLRKSLPRS